MLQTRERARKRRNNLLRSLLRKERVTLMLMKKRTRVKMMKRQHQLRFWARRLSRLLEWESLLARLLLRSLTVHSLSQEASTLSSFTQPLLSSMEGPTTLRSSIVTSVKPSCFLKMTASTWSMFFSWELPSDKARLCTTTWCFSLNERLKSKLLSTLPLSSSKISLMIDCNQSYQVPSMKWSVGSSKS